MKLISGSYLLSSLDSLSPSLRPPVKRVSAPTVEIVHRCDQRQRKNVEEALSLFIFHPFTFINCAVISRTSYTAPLMLIAQRNVGNVICVC